MSDLVSNGPAVVLPSPWQVTGKRETSQTQNGMVVQGVVVSLTNPLTNVTTSVFIPYTVLPVVSAVQQLITDRINALNALG